MSRRALLLGATGLVGRELLRLLLADAFFSRVVVIARRPTGVRDAKLEEHVLELDKMEQHADLFAVDDVFCALGTTMRVAGTKEQFRVIDHDYAITAARLGHARGATHYLLVSSFGASARSKVFYNRVKGEVEEDLLAIGYRRVTIARPSFLLAEREEKPVRALGVGRSGCLGWIAIRAKHPKRPTPNALIGAVSWLLPRSAKPIAAGDVARALAEAAHETAPGVQILESRSMRRRRQ